nr:hypothetical protein [Tanacetum cinerariifolium]
MSKRQRQLPTSTRRRSKRNIQEVVSAADNGEVVKETQLLDSHENEEGDSIIRLPPVNGNYLKEIQRWEEVVELWVQLMWYLRPKHADWAISSPYYCNLRTPNDIKDWILKDITYPVGWANVEMEKDDRPWWIKFQQMMSKRTYILRAIHSQMAEGMSKDGVFKKKNIHPKGYTITFTSSPNVPK